MKQARTVGTYSSVRLRSPPRRHKDAGTQKQSLQLLTVSRRGQHWSQHERPQCRAALNQEPKQHVLVHSPVLTIRESGDGGARWHHSESGGSLKVSPRVHSPANFQRCKSCAGSRSLARALPHLSHATKARKLRGS